MGKGEIISSFRRGLRPRHPGGGSLRFGARGEESVAYRLAGAGRVQPRGCKGRSPLHEITLVSPSPEGKRRGIGAKHPSVFAGGSAPGTPAAGAYGSAQRGKESVAYRLARAVRVQPRGCKGRSPLHEITLVSPSPEGKRRGIGAKHPSVFAGGSAPGTPAAGAYGSAQRGKESVAYRLARAVRVQPRGCKGRSPLHETTLVSPSPEGKGRGDGGKNALWFSPGAKPGRRGFNFGYPLPVGFAGTRRFKSIQIREKFWGVWGTLSRVPQRLPSAPPPRLQRFSFSGRWCRLWYRPA